MVHLKWLAIKLDFAKIDALIGPIDDKINFNLFFTLFHGLPISCRSDHSAYAESIFNLL